jgi:hypothetical protein
MSKISIDDIKESLLGVNDPAIRFLFVERYSQSLEVFAEKMHIAFEKWHAFDQHTNKDLVYAHISALTYAALNTHLIAMKMFLEGLFVPAGNSQRYVLECIATAFLVSKPSLGYLKRFVEGKYSTTKSIHQVMKIASKLELDEAAFKVLDEQRKLYDETNHPTLFSFAGIIAGEGHRAKIILGASYDENKLFAYDREIKSRVDLASLMPDFVSIVQNNFLKDKQ